MGQRKKAAFVRRGAPPSERRGRAARRERGRERAGRRVRGDLPALCRPGRDAEAGPESGRGRHPPAAGGSSPHLQNPQGGKLNSSVKTQIHLLDELITANY